MTDDIVVRLQDAAVAEQFDEPAELLCDAVREIERLRCEADGIAAWIVSQTGYPLDFVYREPAPKAWRRRIEDAWLRWHEARDLESDDDLRMMVRTEGGWE